jgi:hypothetical protein
MTSNVIRDLLLAVPFRPFTVHVAEGKNFRIEHPECVAILQSERMIFINTKNDDYEWVDVFLVTRVESSAPQQTV